MHSRHESERHTLSVERLAHGGAGVSRLPDGRAVFVEGACPGDTVTAVITGSHARHATARVTTVLSPGPDRIEPPCPYAGACGGCQWQHIAYAAQLAAKREIVIDSLERIGGFADAARLVHDVVAGPETLGYRNKIELAAEFGSSGLRLGFHAPASHDIVQVDSCLLLPKRARTAPKSLRGVLRYLSGSHDLGIVRVGLRVAAHTRDTEVAIWTRPSSFPRAAASAIGDAIGASGIVRVIARDAPERAVAGLEVLKGKGAWRERLSGRTMYVSAPSFFQVNTKAAEELVRITIGALAPSEDERVLDLYAGAGTFSLPVAELGAHTVAVESSRYALADLERNATAAEVYVDRAPGDAARVLAGLGTFDGAIVDPPRAGLSPEALEALAATRAARIVYVSCDPATLSRDVRRLAECGYRLESVVPVDLFPQTYHVESVAVLRGA